MSKKASGETSMDANGSLKLDFQEEDQISKYLERMKENRGKDAMEIVDNIEQREAKRRQELLDLYFAERFSSTNRDKLSQFDLEKQRSRIKFLFGRVKMKNRLEKDF